MDINMRLEIPDFFFVSVKSEAFVLNNKVSLKVGGLSWGVFGFLFYVKVSGAMSFTA